MKRFAIIITLSLMALGCHDIREDITDLKSRLTLLEGTKIATIDEQIESINGTIKELKKAKESLEGHDGELDNLIQQLQSYVDESLVNEKDWVKATYATLAQYNILSDKVANMQLEFDGALTSLESSLKNWVGEALTGYYDMAAIDAKLSALATQEQMQEEIGNLKTQITDAKAELTTAYQEAISKAIETNNGVIDSKIATEIGKVQSRINSEVSTINQKISDLEKRVKALEDLVAGLKVSDSVFGFVMYTQKDTITKGLKFPITFRVNPSGVPFTKDMVVLDNMSSTKFLVEEDVKASYITESKNFYVDSLGKTRNASEEEMDGQYFARMANKDTRNMIDDNLFSLVGAYRDKNDVVQYVSSNPFQVVMMPTPEEGLYPWLYAHGSATRLVQVITPEVPAEGDTPAQEGRSYFKEELGSITFSLDSRSYKQENGTAKQSYSTKKYIRTLSFEGDTKADSIVIFQPVKDSGFVRFIPDTSKAEWAALLDTTKLASLKVKGKIVAADRFGGASSFPVEMTWYSRHIDTVDVVKKVSDFYTADGTKQPVYLDLESEFEKLGFYYLEVDSARRKVHESFVTSSTGGRVIFSTAVNAGPKQCVTGRVSVLGSQTSLPGTYYLSMVNGVKSIPCDNDLTKTEDQITAVVTIRLTITDE